MVVGRRESRLFPIAVVVVLVGCSSAAPIAAPPSTNGPASVEVAETSSTTPPTTAIPSTTVAEPPSYVFPVIGRKASYARTHHDYPASDIFACGAYFVAPTDGTIDAVSTVDRWDPSIDDPATRGGLFVSLVGADGVRYYGAHLDQVIVEPGQAVDIGEPLGVIGATGNARNSACHLHFGISRPCPGDEWAVRRGEIWPWPYLDAWQAEEDRSPGLEIYATAERVPDACAFAEAAVPPG